MLPEQPLLTVAIPTYNRCQFLEVLLTSLLPQLIGETRVELLISNNASTDGTQATLDKFKEQGLLFTHILNTTNIGADHNFLQCFERASGQYVWIVGDDDVFLPGGLLKVLEFLSSAEYDLVYVTSYTFQGPYHPAATVPYFPPEIITDANVFASKVHVSMTFISGNIVNKNRVSSLPHPSFHDLIGTNLLQLGWVYTALRYMRRGLYIREPLLAARADNTGGYALCTVFGVGLKRITEQWLQEPSLVKIVLNRTAQLFFPHFLLKMKTSEYFHEEDAHAVLRPVFGSNYRYWLFDYPIIKLPVTLARSWLLASNLMLKLDSYFKFGIFD